MLLGIDVSSHQYPPNTASPIDYDAVRTDGQVGFVVAKATEGGPTPDGDGYRNPYMERDRSESRRVGFGFGMYHYARGGNPLDEANFFCDTVGPLNHGEFLWLDWEIEHNNPPVWCRTFNDQVYTRTGVRPTIYMDRSRLTGYNWGPVIAGNYGLCVASYDNNPGSLPNPVDWEFAAFKQFTDNGSIGGIGGAVDRLAFYGDRVALDAYGFQGATPDPSQAPEPSPPPPVVVPQSGADSLPGLEEGQKGEVIRRLQSFFNANYPAYSDLPVTGWYGPQTTAVVAEFQARSGIDTPDADGSIIGPKTNAALWAAGWRG